MRHKFLVLTVKELLKSVYIYGSYHKIKTVITFLDHPGTYMKGICKPQKEQKVTKRCGLITLAKPVK